MEDLRSTEVVENQEENTMGMFQRIIGIYLSPYETMKSIISKPGIILPLIVMTVGVLGLMYVQYDLYIDYMSRMMEMAVQEKNQVILTHEQAVMTSKMVFYFTPLSSLVMWFAGAAILFGILKIFKGQGKYKQYLSVTGYAYLIPIASMAIVDVVAIFSGNLNLDMSLANIVTLFVPDMKGTYFYGVLRGIGLFEVWMYTVIAIGVCELSKVDKRIVYGLIGLGFTISVFMNAGSYKFM